MQRTRYRLLVLDPSAGLAAGVAALLDGGEGLTAEGRGLDPRLEALEAFATAPLPDAVMIDPGEFTLPPQGLAPRLRDRFGTARLIGYAGKENPALARRCLQAGFTGFLAKSATLETIRLCIAAVQVGAVFVDASHASAIVPALEGPALTPCRSLTEREAYVLKSVARGKSLKEIGYELALSSKTVETYKARGTSKLNISGRREIVEYAIRAGWV